MIGEALSADREAIRDIWTGSAHPAFPSRFRTCSANARTKKNVVRAVARPLTPASARKGPSSEFPTYFSDVLAD